MTYRDGVLTGTIATALVAGMAGTILWLTRSTDSKSGGPKPPAQVQQTLKEEQINTIALTPEALLRLNLQVAEIESKPRPRSRIYGGEAMIPLGRTIVVQAPMNGTLRTPPGGLPLPGQVVKSGQPILIFHPLLTPEALATLTASKIDAEAQEKTAETHRNGAIQTRDRAKKVFESEAGSRRALEEAQVLLDVAEKTLEAARARKGILVKLLGDLDHGAAAGVSIYAPSDGMLRNVSVVPGQSVPAGTALFEIIDTSQMWIKVSVYSGETSDVDPVESALVSHLSARANDWQKASPAPAPPSANPQSGTVDLYYSMDNLNSKFRPGERVSVQVALKGEAKSLVVPWSAVVYDIFGDTWIYEQLNQTTFVRRRVVVRAVVGADALLVHGPPPSTRVVSAGAAELFGTETGFTK
jgi:multidrug efflux pump subunit AcrA (membrane-fusion protein)